MYWRTPRDVWATSTAERNRDRMRRFVRRGVEPGLLGYQDGEPVAWVSLGPREDFPALENSRLLRRVDDRPVWSIVCFFVRRDRRRSGWMRRLLKAATAYAADHGATLLEGYPIECGTRELTGYTGYTGIASTYRAAGFREVARRRSDLPIMRRTVRRAAPRQEEAR